MNRFLQILLISVLLTGCAGPLKQGWQNFTAYYNTFYNASRFYEEGLEKNTSQRPEINPEVPIRIHIPPSAAGREEFSNAIERGASILRKHEESKYVTRALSLIGKSYYYRSEFFAALEKFQELQAVGNREEVQAAILWQGRVFLEMDAISEGIRFLETEKEQTEDWVPAIRAEVEILLAQLYTELGNWEMALDYISDSVSDVEDRDIAARTFFLQGQLFEKTGRYEQALYSYSRIQDIRTGYNLEFNALRKEADVSRQLGNYNRALDLFNRMERDDKLLEYQGDLQYEIARTYQQQGSAEASFEQYSQILTERFYRPSRLVQAKTYYGIAEIYRDHFNDFSLAAAYYDSAANVQADASLLPEDFNAQELASSYGEYASVKNEISDIDSLLYLGSLSVEELDSVLVEVQKARQMERNEEMRRMQDLQDQAVFTEESTDSMIDAAEGAGEGFLNINNPQKVRDASLQFQAVWGDRPLADNWRRRAAVRGSRYENPVVLTDGNNRETSDISETAMWQGEEDVSSIPFTDEEKEEMTVRKEELTYRLANVFFLSLNLPDSAKIYYRQVADSSSRDNLVSRSLYSLAEIELLEGNQGEAESWAQKLIEDYPGTVYTQRITERLDIPHSVSENSESENLESLYDQLSENFDGNPAEKAKELQLLADKSSAIQRPYLLYEAAREYVKAAQTLSGGVAEFVPADSSGEEMELVADTSRITGYSYEGAYWDSTRSVLDQIETNYPSSEVIPSVKILKETVQLPDAEAEEPDNETAAVNEREPENNARACDELDPPVEISGGMNAFLDNVVFPDWAREITMRGEIGYLFRLSPDGTIEYFEQQSRMDRTGIPQAFEQAIEEHLTFEPTRREDTMECTVTFPVNL